MGSHRAWLAGIGLHGVVLVVPATLLSLATGIGCASAGSLALLAWVVGTAAEDDGVGVERAVPRFEQARALLLLGYLWGVGLGGPAPLAARVVGLALLVGGLAMRRWAIRTLGAGFRTALHTGPWVRTGPYAWLGHPSEVGLAIATLGAAWMAGSALALVIWPVLVGLPASVRVWMEEAAHVRERGRMRPEVS